MVVTVILRSYNFSTEALVYAVLSNVYSHTAVDCSSLDDPDNGQVTLSGTTLGSTATYTCNPGFVLDGTDVRTCMANGEWSGEVPTCNRK